MKLSWLDVLNKLFKIIYSFINKHLPLLQLKIYTDHPTNIFGNYNYIKMTLLLICYKTVKILQNIPLQISLLLFENFFFSNFTLITLRLLDQFPEEKCVHKKTQKFCSRDFG